MKKYPIEILRRLYRQRYKKPVGTHMDPSDMQPEILQQLKKNGVVTLRDFYSKEFCIDIINSINKYIESHANVANVVHEKVKQVEFKRGVPMEDGTNYWIDSLESDRRILFSEKINKNIKDFSCNEKFINQGKLLLENEIKLQFTMANKTVFLPNNLGSGGGWHRDNNYQHGYKALVYLSDVNDDNGPFEYIKQTFTLKNHVLDFPYPDKYQFTEEEINKFIAKHSKLYIRITATAGTVVLFNTNGIHRGMPLKKGTRYALTNYYI